MSDLQMDEKHYFEKGWWTRKDVRETAIIWVILSAVIGYGGSKLQTMAMGDPASEVMENVIRIIQIFTWVAAPVAGLVAAICVHALLAKRHHGDNPPPESDHQISKSPRASAAWIVVSGLLCLFALVVGLIALEQDTENLFDQEAIHVNVVGQQWAWNYDYAGTQGVRSQVLHLPVDKAVIFHVTSKDVKHSFWVVQMGIKIDANPGYVTETAVTPNKIGTFDIRCAELCGLLHAYMQNKVIVESQADYDAWIASQPNLSQTDPLAAPEEGGA